MSDPGNTPAPKDDRSTEADRSLDALLQSAKWPEPSADAIERLQSRWSELSAEQDRTVTTIARAERTGVSVVSRRRISPISAVIAAAAIAAAAFWMGRTTAPKPVDSFVESDQRSESSSIDNAPQNPKPIDVPESRDDPPPPQNIVTDSPEMSPPETDPETTPPSTVPESVLHPEIDPVRRTHRGVAAAQRQRDSEELDAVLACLIDKPDADATCCRPLMRRRAAFEYLLWEVVQNSTGQRQSAAVTAIGFVGTSQSIPSLIQTAGNQDLRGVAVQALKRRADERLLVSIVSQNEDAEVAREFAIELIRRDTTAAAKAILDLIKDGQTRNRCLEIVDLASNQMVEAWYSALDSSLVSDRVAAAMALGRRTDRRTQDRLRQLIAAYPTRWEPVAALMAGGSDEAMKDLTSLQQQPGRYAVIQTATIQLNSLLSPDAPSPKSR